ncbi:flavodoxin domain-containing protein [Eubacteriaceae bacterium ES3]|nr:flavodoxin domain-containing protein [Eubacteriaceae bacterium ES3]
MKTLVIYKSDSGHTKEYAQALANHMDCQAIAFNQVSKVELTKYDQLVFGGWVRASAIVGLSKFIKLIPGGSNQRLAVFAVGANGASEENTRKLMEKNSSISELGCPLFYLQGGFDPEKLKFPLRIMLEKVAKSLKKKQDAEPESLSAEDREFLEFFQSKHNDVDSRNLAEIEAFLKA